MRFPSSCDSASRVIPALLAVAALALAPAPAAANDPSPDLARQRLTGDWGGLRTRLLDRGVDVFAEATNGVVGNVSGGLETGSRYLGFARWGVDLDLEKLVGARHTVFHIDWFSYHGGQPSEDLVGAFPTSYVSGLEAERSVRFYEIYLKSFFFDERLELKLGQITIDDDFFVSEYAGTLLNAAFGYFSSGRDLQLAPFYPLAGPGAYAAIRPCDRIGFRLGAYVADVGEDVRGNIGFDAEFDDGGTFLAQIDLALELLGRASAWSIGTIVSTRDVTDFEAGGFEGSVFGVFALLDQVLWTDARGEPKLGAFVRGGWNPQGDRSVIDWYLNAGFDLYAPLPGRPEDVLAVGFTHTEYAADYRRSQRSAGVSIHREQSVIELTYRAALTGWLSLQPDLQVFFDPAFGRDTSLVLTLQLGITF